MSGSVPGASVVLRSHLVSSSSPLFHLGCDSSSIPSPPKLGRGLCRGALDWGHPEPLRESGVKGGLRPASGGLGRLCVFFVSDVAPGVSTRVRGETGSQREEVKAEGLEGVRKGSAVSGRAGGGGEERRRLSSCWISVLRQREAKTQKKTYIFRFCF